jgi:hypothetical protein
MKYIEHVGYVKFIFTFWLHGNKSSTFGPKPVIYCVEKNIVTNFVRNIFFMYTVTNTVTVQRFEVMSEIFSVI